MANANDPELVRLRAAIARAVRDGRAADEQRARGDFAARKAEIALGAAHLNAEQRRRVIAAVRAAPGPAEIAAARGASTPRQRKPEQQR